jgi:hypothetical protein
MRAACPGETSMKVACPGGTSMKVAWHEVPANRHNGAADRSANPKGILHRSLCAARFEKRQQEIEMISDSANVFRMEPYREQKLDHCSRFPSWDGQAMRSDRIDRPSGTVRSFSLFQALRARLLSLKSLRDRLLSLKSLRDKAVRTKPTNRVKLTLIGLGFPDRRLRR